jgi:hypothetical protein
MSFRSKPSRHGSGPPAWLVFLVAVALVFGAFYLYQGAQNFVRTGGLGVSEATSRAQVVETATAQQQDSVAATRAPSTQRPTLTPIPECIDFRVIVPNAIVRAGPSESSAILGGLSQGEVVCVLGRQPDSDWYEIDQNPETRRLDLAYMNEVVIEAVNPTLTPSQTLTALPTVTAAPTETPSLTPIPSNTAPATRTPLASAEAPATSEVEPTETPVPATIPPIQNA